jgi:hypothetical protein
MTIKQPILGAILLGLVVVGCQGKSGPEATVELIKKLGGKVVTNDSLPNKPIVMVDLRNTAVTDEQLKCLKELPQMQMLVLDDTGISDAGLETLKEYDQLQRIYLRTTRVTPGGVQDLKKAFPKAEIEN